MVSGEQRLSVLLEAYRLERQEDSSYQTMQATFVSLALATAALVAGLLSDTCSAAGWSGGCGFPPGFLVALPLLPLAFFAYVTVNGLRATLRSYYLRALEREIGSELGSIGTLGSYPDLAFPRSAELSLYAHPTAVRRQSAVRAFGLLVVLSMAVAFVAFVAWVFAVVPTGYRLVMLGFYVPAAAFLVGQVRTATAGGRRYFRRAVLRLQRSLEDDLLPAPPGPRRSSGLVRYLLLPRPDSLPKAVLAPVAFAVTAALMGLPALGWGPFLAVVAVFELLFYQARYQWNDIRGIREDAADAMAGVRGRLPVGRTPASRYFALRASQAVIAFRIYLGICVLGLVGSFAGETYRELGLGSLLVLGVLGVLYEVVRDPRRLARPSRGRVALVALGTYVVVVLGYVLRGWLGLASASIDAGSSSPATGWFARVGDLVSGVGFVAVPGDVRLAVLGVAAGFGLLVVSATWALNGVSQLKDDDEATCTALADSLRGSRPHVAYALRGVGDLRGLFTRASASPARCSDGGYARALARRTSPVAPWNVGVFIGVAALGVGGCVSVLGWSWTVALLTTTVIAACVALALSLTGPAGRLVVVVAFAALSFSPVLLGVVRAHDATRWVVGAAAPATALVATYILLTRVSYRAMKESPRRIQRAVLGLPARVGGVVFGAGAREVVDEARRASARGESDLVIAPGGVPGNGP